MNQLRCPRCGASAGVPLVFGFPGPEAFERERAGKIVLGGCDLSPAFYGDTGELPDTACRSCGHQWLAPKTASESS